MIAERRYPGETNQQGQLPPAHGRRHERAREAARNAAEPVEPLRGRAGRAAARQSR
jgi:hypothetical protein